MEIHILEILKAVILGVVEGVTEFLPISSTGHLILVNEFISFDKGFTVLFDIVIQLGAILAVLIYFIDDLWPFTKDKIKKKNVLNIWYKTIVAVLPALFFGALFASFIKDKLFSPIVVAITLFVGGLIILWTESRNKNPKIVSMNDLSYKDAFIIGLVQCVAMIPGVSRSGATIIGGMMLGTSRTIAAEFSFFLAIPTMMVASAHSLLKYKGTLTSENILVLVVGFIVSFFVALIVVKYLMAFIKKHDFKIFGYYRIVLGLIVLVYFIV